MYSIINLCDILIGHKRGGESKSSPSGLNLSFVHNVYIVVFIYL